MTCVDIAVSMDTSTYAGVKYQIRCDTVYTVTTNMILVIAAGVTLSIIIKGDEFILPIDMPRFKSSQTYRNFFMEVYTETHFWTTKRLQILQLLYHA